MSTAIDAGPQGAAPTTPHAEPSSGRGLASRGGQVATLLVVLFAIVTAFVGSGVLGGTPIQDAVGGWLSEDGTWIAPASSAFSIWSVIYTGVLAYAVWQFLPSAQSRRHDRLRPWILASLLINAAWIWTVQLGALGLSVLVIFLLLASLCRILVLLETGRARGWVDRILLDGVQGLHLGWVSIASVTNVAAWLGSLGWFGAPLLPTTWALILIVVATVIAALTAVYDGGRFTPAAALAWGLVWVGVGRTDGSGLQSGGVALTAWGCAGVVMLCWLAALLLSRRSATGEARDLVLDALDGGDDPVDGIR